MKTAWEEYQKGIDREWKNYLAEKAAAFKAYAAIESRERARLLSKGRPLYLDLARSSPGDTAEDSEFILAARRAHYSNAVKAAYAAYLKAEKEALDRCDAAASKLFKAYQKAAEEARAATQARR
jgi:hypothetical protein